MVSSAFASSVRPGLDILADALEQPHLDRHPCRPAADVPGKAIRISDDLADVAEVLSVGVVVCDEFGHPIRVNQAFLDLLGYSLEELHALPPWAVTHPDDRPQELALFREVVSGTRDSYVIEKRCTRKSGDEFWARFRYRVRREPDGTALTACGLLEDITMERQSREPHPRVIGWSDCIPPAVKAQLRLTAREAAVASLLARGCSAKRIAADIGISWHTARGHIERVLRKLGIRSQAEVGHRLASLVSSVSHGAAARVGEAVDQPES
jgi:PAS domain S-box-containing protein